jgi:hypothetical protein
MIDLDSNIDNEDHPSNPPPGDEAFLQSHAGGEAILHELLDGMSLWCVVSFQREI